MNSINKQDIDKMIELLQESQIKNHQMSLTPTFPFGMPIIEAPHVQDLEPVIKLSDKVNVSVEFRNKCNKFYLDMFGYKEPMIFRTQYGLLMGKNMKNLLVDVSTTHV